MRPSTMEALAADAEDLEARGKALLEEAASYRALIEEATRREVAGIIPRGGIVPTGRSHVRRTDVDGRDGSKAARIVDIASKLIDGASGPVSSREITDAVKAAGVPLGANPQNMVASTLSRRSEEFEAVGRKGYIRKTRATASEATAPAGIAGGVAEAGGAAIPTGDPGDVDDILG